MEQLSLFAEEEKTEIARFGVLDVETTGLPRKGGDYSGMYVIELAVRREDNETLESLVRPEVMEIKPNITAITGITTDMVSPAPEMRALFPKFLDFMDGRIMVAHNAPFDRGWLVEEARRLGISYSPDFIDTLSLARYFYPDIPHLAGRSRYTLENLCTYFEITNESAHRAFADVDATYRLFQEFLYPAAKEQGLNPVNFEFKSRQRRVG